ncbi:MAG TPA: AarF/UbiB family protein [Gemmatimonadales bacterium]|nr:AarF/UbiB family protein [Gemmatimonadales bacterium]
MRLLVILRYAVPLAVSFLRDRRRWLLAGRPVIRTPAFEARRSARLLTSITRLGPSFVKLGQVFAGRADLLPEPYARDLSRLTDQVPPAPEAAVRAVLEASLGRPVEDVFDRFDPEPIAAGSLGQVYRASYRTREVAVKVLRPGVRDLVARDIAAARRIMDRVVGLVPNVHTRAAQAVVAEFSVRVREEMDFRREAENLLAVRANFSGNPRVRIPSLVPELSTGDVLVLEYMQGTRIDRLEPGVSYGGVRAETVVERLIELYVQMMLVDGFFHADPHAGNLLVARDGALVLLDFGLVIRVPRERRKQLVDTAFAAIRNDPRGVVDGFYALDIIEPGAERARIERLADTLLDLAAQRTTTQERIDVLTREIMDELYNWPIRLPSDLVYFARTANLIEGIGVRYDPLFNPVMSASPVLFRMRGRLLASLSDQPLLDQLDWPTAIGYLLGRATRMIRTAGDRIAALVGSL